MRFRSLVVAGVCLLGAIGAEAQYLLSPMAGANGAQLQIGVDFPFPDAAGIFLGGMTPINGGTMGGGPVSDGPGRAFWPPLLIRRNPASMGSIMQGLSTAQGGAITVPPDVLSNRVGTLMARAPVPVLLANFSFFQLRTTADHAWPAATAVFEPGGGPGIPGTPVVLTGPGGGSIVYNAGTKSFGGAAEFALTPGPFAGLPPLPVPVNGQGKPPVITVWMNIFKQVPATAFKLLMLGASNGAGVAAGRSVAAPALTTMFGPVPNAVKLYPATLGGFGPAGTVPPSSDIGGAPSALVNPVTASKGFPWTTGFITVLAPGPPPETFYLSGGDDRVDGVGNLSMVSGALSQRKLTGSNANRGWVTLTIPEPAAALGIAAALGLLTLCHARVRRSRNYSSRTN
jgi:hypothetical protein